MDQLTTPLVSVIIPIYQAEKTLCKALDSVLGQTLTEFEVILIDDGSTDNSGYICDEYVRKDKRVKVVHQCNKGVSAARQCGIERARGEYSIHVDPDDWVEPEMLQELYRCAKRHDADMVICDFYINSPVKQSYIGQKPSSLESRVVLKEIFDHLMGSCCNKLIRTACYRKYNISFPNEVSFCEDEYVICSLLKYDIKVDYLPKAFYHYVKDSAQGTLSKHYDKNSLHKDLQLRELYATLLQGTGVEEHAYQRKSAAIVSRAFIFGKEVFTSAEFHKIFYRYKNIIWTSPYSLFEKILLYVSMLGFYQPTIKIVSALIHFKHKLLS